MPCRLFSVILSLYLLNVNSTFFPTVLQPKMSLDTVKCSLGCEIALHPVLVTTVYVALSTGLGTS